MHCGETGSGSTPGQMRIILQRSPPFFVVPGVIFRSVSYINPSDTMGLFLPHHHPPSPPPPPRGGWGGLGGGMCGFGGLYWRRRRRRDGIGIWGPPLSFWHSSWTPWPPTCIWGGRRTPRPPVGTSCSRTQSGPGNPPPPFPLSGKPIWQSYLNPESDVQWEFSFQTPVMGIVLF